MIFFDMSSSFVMGCILGFALVNSYCRKCKRYQRHLEEEYKINKELFEKIQRDRDSQ